MKSCQTIKQHVNQTFNIYILCNPISTFELLHDDEDSLRSLEHSLQVDDPGVVQVLQDRHLVLQGRLLLRGESQFVDHL